LLDLDSEQVGLRALKQAEERESLILRFYELWGRPTDEVRLTLNPALVGEEGLRAWETDGCERRQRELPVQGNAVRFKMGAFGIQTIELQPGSSAAWAARPRAAPLALPYDLCAFTTDGERPLGALPGGRSFPRELLPAAVACGGVSLPLALDEPEQAMACRGQEIPLPAGAAAGGYDTLLLLASADEDLETAFTLDETPVRLQIQAGEGFVGQGERRTWNRPMDKQPEYRFWAKATGVEPGWIKRDRVGLYTTHMHSPEGNEPYAFGYAYLYRLPLPAGASVLRAPDDPRVRLYAAAAVRGLRTVDAAAPLY
jgi:alpha-mannosidase